MINTYEKKKEIIYMLVFVLIIVSIGMISCIENNNDPSFFIFGCIFFFSGFFIGMYVKYFGLIFLFSHGGSGFFIIMAALLGNFNSDNPLLTDVNPDKIKYYLYTIATLTIVGFISVILYNVSEKFKSKTFAIFIPTTALTIAILLAAILPNMIDKLI